MNGSEILNIIRSRYLDDVLASGDDANALWSDDDIFGAIDEAYKRFAIDTRMLRDSRTASIVQLAVTADDEWVDVSDKILEIKKARLNSNGARLGIIDHQWLDQGYLNINDYFNFSSSPLWEDDEGTPKAIIINLEHNAVRVYPIPTDNDQINLTVIRLPLKEVNSSTKAETLEFTDLWKNAIVFGSLHELYLKQDSDETEGVDTDRSDHFDKLYQRQLTSAVRHRERTQKSTQTNTTRYGGII